MCIDIKSSSSSVLKLSRELCFNKNPKEIPSLGWEWAQVRQTHYAFFGNNF